MNCGDRHFGIFWDLSAKLHVGTPNLSFIVVLDLFLDFIYRLSTTITCLICCYVIVTPLICHSEMLLVFFFFLYKPHLLLMTESPLLEKQCHECLLEWMIHVKIASRCFIKPCQSTLSHQSVTQSKPLRSEIKDNSGMSSDIYFIS